MRVGERNGDFEFGFVNEFELAAGYSGGQWAGESSSPGSERKVYSGDTGC